MVVVVRQLATVQRRTAEGMPAVRESINQLINRFNQIYIEGDRWAGRSERAQWNVVAVCLGGADGGATWGACVDVQYEMRAWWSLRLALPARRREASAFARAPACAACPPSAALSLTSSLHILLQTQKDRLHD